MLVCKKGEVFWEEVGGTKVRSSFEVLCTRIPPSQLYSQKHLAKFQDDKILSTLHNSFVLALKRYIPVVNICPASSHSAGLMP